MSTLAIGLFALYLGLAFVLRTLLQRRATGSSGFNGISGSVGSAEWNGGVLFVVAIALGLAAPVLALTGTVEPLDTLDTTGAHGIGLALYAIGLGGTLAAQSAMGASWRIGVSAEDRTSLVTDGPFAIVRNPIFSFMLPTALGLALLTPNVVAIGGVLSLFAALELQTRVVEEPYLLRVHGEDYGRYAARVGRFVPGLGRLRSEV